MSGLKRKGRASPDIEEFDEEDQESPQRGRRMEQDQDSSQRVKRSISGHDDFPNEEKESMRYRGTAPRPGGGGYRQPGIDMRHHGDYERQYSPSYYRPGPSSSRVRIVIPDHLKHMEELEKVVGGLIVRRAGRGRDQDVMKITVHQSIVTSIMALSRTCKIQEVASVLCRGQA